MIFLFWVAIVAILYPYVLFPLLLTLRGLLAARPHLEAEVTPSVSIIVAAHNEADVIGQKIASVLAADYPEECLQLVVASDGSTDATNRIVRDYEQSHQSGRVVLLELPRGGKAIALNKAVALASGEILVFTDANSMFAGDTLKKLVRPFADSTVGGVAGNQLYQRDDVTSLAGEGEKRYWGFDRKLKLLESQAGNTISATGALYAIRRSLFEDIPDGVTDDFYNSVGVVAQGYRLVFAPEAVVFEPVAKSSKGEFRRKVRVMTRGLTAVVARRELLNPFRYGFYAWQLLSHKVLRRLVVFPLLLLAIANSQLWHRSRIYRLSAVGQLGLYGLAGIGALTERRGLPLPRLLALPYYFVLVNLAALLAVINVIRGERIVLWQSQRTEMENERGQKQ